VFLMAILIFLPATLGYLFWGFYGIRGWFGDRRTQLTRRKQLAALFTQQDGADPSMIERLIHDDEAYGQRIGRFLQERQVRMPVPLYDKQGRYRFRCSEKVKVLARAIVRAVSGAPGQRRTIPAAPSVTRSSPPRSVPRWNRTTKTIASAARPVKR
jgi:hypothetical protein